MQLTRRVGTLHSYMTLASSLLILKQSSCLKKKKNSIYTCTVQANLAHNSFPAMGLLALGCFIKAPYLTFKVRTLLPLRNILFSSPSRVLQLSTPFSSHLLFPCTADSSVSQPAASTLVSQVQWWWNLNFSWARSHYSSASP